MELLIQGALLGILLTSMVGPIFAALVETSIERGRVHGFWVGLGIWTSDFMFISICLLAIVPVTNMFDPSMESSIRIAAGGFFILFGLWFIFKRSAIPDFDRIPTPKELAAAWTKGFLVNTLNPFTFLFWFGTTISLLGQSTGKDLSHLFYIGVMAVVIPGDLLKVFLADKLRHKLTVKKFTRLRWLAGLAFALFGAWLVIEQL
jgi:threonine/homoserine/homoserine lactone efflux protein